MSFKDIAQASYCEDTIKGHRVCVEDRCFHFQH